MDIVLADVTPDACAVVVTGIIIVVVTLPVTVELVDEAVSLSISVLVDTIVFVVPADTVVLEALAVVVEVDILDVNSADALLLELV